jgi:hypothetical protein
LSPFGLPSYFSKFSLKLLEGAKEDFDAETKRLRAEAMEDRHTDDDRERYTTALHSLIETTNWLTGNPIPYYQFRCSSQKEWEQAASKPLLRDGRTVKIREKDGSFVKFKDEDTGQEVEFYFFETYGYRYTVALNYSLPGTGKIVSIDGVDVLESGANSLRRTFLRYSG